MASAAPFIIRVKPLICVVTYKEQHEIEKLFNLNEVGLYILKFGTFDWKDFVRNIQGKIFSGLWIDVSLPKSYKDYLKTRLRGKNVVNFEDHFTSMQSPTRSELQMFRLSTGLDIFKEDE